MAKGSQQYAGSEGSLHCGKFELRAGVRGFEVVVLSGLFVDLHCRRQRWPARTSNVKRLVAISFPHGCRCDATGISCLVARSG